MTSSSEILRLNAGRETDILVAEQVVGWKIETDAAKLRKLNAYFSRDEKRRWWRSPEGGWYDDPPTYSSDIAAAWLVVEVMNSKGQFLFLSQSGDEYNVAFDIPSSTGPDYTTGTSITLAICKGALAARERVEAGIVTESIAQRATPATALT